VKISSFRKLIGALAGIALAGGILSLRADSPPPADGDSDQQAPSLLLMHNFQGYTPLAPSAAASAAPAPAVPSPSSTLPAAKPVPAPAPETPPAIHPLDRTHDEQPLNAQLGQLKGIVILGSYKEFKSEGVGNVHGLDIVGPSFLKPHKAMLSVWLSDFVGKPLGTNALSHMQTYLIRACRQLDHPVVDVYYPEQEIIDGVVQVIVYEGKVSRVEVVHLDKKKWFKDSTLTRRIHLKPGGSISQKTLIGDLEKLNRDPQFLEVGAFYKQATWGADETNSGSTDIGLTVKERFPLRVFAGYDNYGLKVLGENQIFGGFNYGNLFGVMDQLNYQYTTDVELRSLQAHTASFLDPLPWGHTLTIFGGYNFVQADLSKIGFANLRNDGYTYQLGIRYIVPLPHWWGLDHDISAGYDFKSADTAIEFGQVSFSPFAAEIDQFTLSYRARLTDKLGYSQMTMNGYYSPGGLLGRNADANFSSFHKGLKSDYYYGRVDGERAFNLPFGLWLRGKMGYQNSSTGLLPSEEVYLGGESILRGYPEDIESGDQGYYATVELHSPLIRTGNLTGQKNLPGQPVDGDVLDVFGFFDYGAVDAVAPNTSGFVSLDSIGAGLSYHVSQNLKADFTYGFQLKHLPASTPTALSQDHSRADVSATVAF
jgi:hemolysin activation/secretion protein